MNENMREMTTKEVQRLSLDILQDFHDYCVSNNLHYSLSGGTLLGAIRHNGFIPWDDDIDVQMPRPDYDRFLNSYVSKKGFKVFSRECPGFVEKKMVYNWARICDTKRSYVDTGIRPWISEDVGIWIDVLPCDGISSDQVEAEKYLDRLNKLVLKTYWLGIRYSSWLTFRKGRNQLEKLKFLVKKVISYTIKPSTMDEIREIRKKYSYDDSVYFFATAHYGMKEWQPKKNMESFELHKFEGSDFYIMSGWNANLKNLYGDYMTLPPENERISHDFNKYYWK
jgi:lipopolysaccharide cholinephosphotransferase